MIIKLLKKIGSATFATLFHLCLALKLRKAGICCFKVAAWFEGENTHVCFEKCERFNSKDGFILRCTCGKIFHVKDKYIGDRGINPECVDEIIATLEKTEKNEKTKT